MLQPKTPKMATTGVGDKETRGGGRPMDCSPEVELSEFSVNSGRRGFLHLHLHGVGGVGAEHTAATRGGEPCGRKGIEACGASEWDG